jgi:hypothetical protein
VPIPRPEESYRLWCVTVCDLETSVMRRTWSSLDCCATLVVVMVMVRGGGESYKNSGWCMLANKDASEHLFPRKSGICG